MTVDSVVFVDRFVSTVERLGVYRVQMSLTLVTQCLEYRWLNGNLQTPEHMFLNH